MKITRIITGKAAGALVLAGAMVASLALAGKPDAGSAAARIAPPNANAFGNTLAEWLSTYWRWYYSGADLASSKVGQVQLMPLPVGEQTGGDWTPTNPAVLVGQLEITLPPGTPFVLPVFAWVGERYEGYPAVPDDPPMDNAVALSSVHPVLTIDGRTVLSDANKAAFYIPPTAFDPIVAYSTPTDYGAVGAAFFQGVGIVSPPLPVGRHVIHLDEPLIIPPGAYSGLPDGIGLIYHNTWIVTVTPK
jgi:hypothetical protein